MLLGRRAERHLNSECPASRRGPTINLIQATKRLTILAIAPNAQIPETTHLDHAVSIGADPDEVPDAELSGLFS